MTTLNRTAPLTWANSTQNTTKQTLSLWQRYTAFADSQASNRTLWFFISLMVHGVLFLPVPAVLMYYYNAPIAVLVITMTCFFTNFIANMGGAGIRTTILCFAVSILAHLAMILAFII